MATHDTAKQRMLRFVAVTAFFVFLGWTIPYMVIVPILRVQQTLQMVGSGYPVLIGPDITTLVPCAMATYYVLFGNAVRAFWSRFPWFAPFVLVVFLTSLGTTVMAHFTYKAAANKVSTPGLFIVALVTFLAWRILAVVFGYWRPLERFVVPRLR
jgi:hypothetical protein